MMSTVSTARQNRAARSVVEVFAAEHMDYFSACHTVFCCGSRVRPVADVMRRHAVSLHADDSGALPSRVLLYDGNPPQLLLPAACLMTRFDWDGEALKGPACV